MTFMLWLSADEEHILERIMRAEGTYSKQQAVITAIRDMGAKLGAEFQVGPVDIDNIDNIDNIDQDGDAVRPVVKAP